MARESEPKHQAARVSRRAVLKAMSASLALHAAAPALRGADNAIVQENARPGSWDWYLAKPSRRDEIEAYASTTSVSRGQSFDLFVSVNEPQAVEWKAYRLGHYQGIGGRLIASSEKRQAARQQKTVDRSTGFIECRWHPTFRITPDDKWLTGLYIINLTREDGFQWRVPMIVRETGSPAPVLFKASVTTWQAYNSWGGGSLYVNDREETGVSGPRVHRVSFDRPYHEFSGAGQMLSYEFWMAQWLERRGYDVGYVTNIDLDATPQVLEGRKIILSVGHDEYWTVAERDALDAARDAGTSLAFFSANTGYWRIRLENSSSGAGRRTLVCYKDAALDPMKDSPHTTTLFRSEPNPRPEHALLGVMFGGWTQIDGFPIVVRQPDHWLFNGTGVQAGDTLSHLVGYEWDHARKDDLCPSSLDVIASSAAINDTGEQIPSDMAVYVTAKKSIVFASGTIQWCWGLGVEGYVDPRVQRITENVLAVAGVETGSLTEVPPPSPPREPGTARAVTLLAGTGEPGYKDGPAAEAQFNAPVGIAAAADGTLYVTEARNHTVRVIKPGGEVATLAGGGPFDTDEALGYQDGVGAEAFFKIPTGIAVDSQGRIYVSDTGNEVIRVIDPVTAKVETFAGRTWTSGYRDAANPLDALFYNPRGLAIGPDDSLYVADTGNSMIRRISPAGVETVATRLSRPTGVTVAPDGTLYVVDTGNARVVRIRPDGTVDALAGGRFGDQGGPGARARLRPYEGIAWIDAAVAFCDSANYRIRAIALDRDSEVTTLAGDGRNGTATGSGGTARVTLPRGLTRHRNGLAAADSGNHRILFIEP